MRRHTTTQRQAHVRALHAQGHWEHLAPLTLLMVVHPNGAGRGRLPGEAPHSNSQAAGEQTFTDIKHHLTIYIQTGQHLNSLSTNLDGPRHLMSIWQYSMMNSQVQEPP